MRYCQQPMTPPGKTDQQKGQPLEMLRNQENQLGTEMAEKTILTAPRACSVLSCPALKPGAMDLLVLFCAIAELTAF